MNRTHPVPSHCQSTLDSYRKYVQLRDVLPRTVQSYVAHVRLLAQHFGSDPTTLTENQVRDYFIYLRETKNYRPASMNQAKVAIRVFYHDFLRIDPKWRVFSDIKVVHRDRLPNILSRDEVRTLLSAFDSDRFRTYFSLIYACGLRRSEALAVEVSDIDSAKGRLFVRNGKGGKQRHVPISTEMIQQLRAWWKTHRHPKFIFPSRGRRHKTSGGWFENKDQGWLKLANDSGAALPHEKDRPMSINTVQDASKRNVTRSGLNKRVTTHTLRHCYATHLLESGVSLPHISAYLGHATLHQTLVYLHLTEEGKQDTHRAMSQLYRSVICPNTSPPPPTTAPGSPTGRPEKSHPTSNRSPA